MSHTIHSTFRDCQALENQWENAFRRIIQEDVGPHCLVLAHKRNDASGLSRRISHIAIQKAAGDYTIADTISGNIVAHHETKIEQKNTGNFFLETHSNMSDEPTRMKPGWLFTSDADILWYGFVEKNIVYRIDMAVMRKALCEVVDIRINQIVFQATRLSRYRERPQTKTAQRNRTVGRLVPIADLKKLGAVTKEVTLSAVDDDRFLSLRRANGEGSERNSRVRAI